MNNYHEVAATIATQLAQKISSDAPTMTAKQLIDAAAKVTRLLEPAFKLMATQDSELPTKTGVTPEVVKALVEHIHESGARSVSTDSTIEAQKEPHYTYPSALEIQPDQEESDNHADPDSQTTEQQMSDICNEHNENLTTQ